PSPSPLQALRSFPTRRSSDLTVALDYSFCDEPHGAPGGVLAQAPFRAARRCLGQASATGPESGAVGSSAGRKELHIGRFGSAGRDRKSTRLNSSHVSISYAVF